MAKKYRKKPVEVYAVQWTGTNKAELEDFCGLEGNVTAEIGDYIVRGVHGEFYPCKPDIFMKTYEEVVDG